jgi:D-alanyl-D-alanine carboxypeptidase
MRRGLTVLVAAATTVATTVAVTAAVAAAPVAAAPREPGRDPLQERLDRVVATGGALGALVEVRDGRRAWRASSGVSELGTHRPVPTRGTFRAGSITKTFVATVVLQLAARGRLRLDDTVERWLPGVVPDGDRITLRHLLDHTSGLPDILPTLPLPPSPEFLELRWRTWTALELAERALAQPPTHAPPGAAFAYSNTNYVLLGMVIEAATGRSYRTEVERRIIRPLHLHGTSMPGTSPWLRGPHPHGYVPIARDGAPELVDFTEMNPSLLGAGGEAVSTTSDLNRSFAALLGGRLLPQRLLEEMKTPGTDSRSYGLGLAWRDTSCGIRVYGNDGDALAYQSWSFSTEDARRQVTIALTPDFTADTDDAVDAFLDATFCP